MIEMTVSGIDRIKDTLNRFSDLDLKLLVIAKRLCDVGRPIIQSVHRTAMITIDPIENGYVIRAEGEDVLFIEFGTGDMAGVTDVLYDQVPPEVGMGTWSATHAQMYVKYGFWVFGGHIYHYTEPHPAFYDAYQAMIEALPQIAAEVFK